METWDGIILARYGSHGPGHPVSVGCLQVEDLYTLTFIDLEYCCQTILVIKYDKAFTIKQLCLVDTGTLKVYGFLSL